MKMTIAIDKTKYSFGQFFSIEIMTKAVLCRHIAVQYFCYLGGEIFHLVGQLTASISTVHLARQHGTPGSIQSGSRDTPHVCPDVQNTPGELG